MRRVGLGLVVVTDPASLSLGPKLGLSWGGSKPFREESCDAWRWPFGVLQGPQYSYLVTITLFEAGMPDSVREEECHERT
eukprot:4206789-Pyramimonas_sp.AAC.1